jgi:hypothetical protein
MNNNNNNNKYYQKIQSSINLLAFLCECIGVPEIEYHDTTNRSINYDNRTAATSYNDTTI